MGMLPPPGYDCNTCRDRRWLRQWPRFWLKRQCSDCSAPLVRSRRPIAPSPMPIRGSIKKYPTHRTARQESSNDNGFVTGVVVGFLLSESRTESPPDRFQAGGGEYGGGGASDTWQESKSENASQDYGPSSHEPAVDSSSSSDSGSSSGGDSGSSSGNSE